MRHAQRAQGAGVSLTNRDRVGKGFELLAEGLEPFVERHLADEAHGGTDWLEWLAKRWCKHNPEMKVSKTDPLVLLRAISQERAAFKSTLSRAEHSYAQELWEWRNSWAHFNAFTEADAHRVLDTMERLLRAAGAVLEAGEVEKLRTELPDLAAAPVPAQLPLDVAGFTGRETELGELEAAAGSGEAMMICAIDGTAGVGKTALAVHFAHRVAERYPDGQLYVNLRGFEPRHPPMSTHEALGGFLRALGVDPRQVPADLAELEGMYRSLTAGRRMLVILDNAGTTGQVRSLLPGAPTCLVLVTSRDRLAGLVARDGARRITLDPLPSRQAVALLARIIGTERITAELQAADSLARLCGYLPLALRIAAEYAAAHPRATLSDLTGWLEAEHSRLDALATNDDESTSIRAVFSSSYRSLPPDAAHAFRLLGLHAGPDISVCAAAALLGAATADTRRQLEALTSRHLLQEPQPGRYRFHNLVRLYAAERAIEEEGEAHRAVQRMLSWYLQAANATNTVLIPQRLRPPRDRLPSVAPDIAFNNRSEALDWCEAEYANLIAATHQAIEAGENDTAWKLPIALTGFFYLHKHWADQIAVYQDGLTAARHAGNPHGETWILLSLGVATRERRRFGESLDHLQAAIALARKIGDTWAEGYAETNVGDIYQSLEQFDEAVNHYQRALTLAREIKQQTGQDPGGDITLTSLADAYRKLGRLADALDCSHQALAIAREIGDRWGEGFAHHSLGTTLHDLRRSEKGIDHLRQGLAIRKEIGREDVDKRFRPGFPGFEVVRA